MPVPPRWVDELLGELRTWRCTQRRRRRSHVRPGCACDHAHSSMRFIWMRRRCERTSRPRIEPSSTSLERIGRHPARFWNFIPDIGAPMVDGLDRYMVFNAGRHDAYSDQCGALGTASAVGIKGSDLSIHCLALEEPGTPVENPRQTPAWQYLSPIRSAASVLFASHDRRPCGTPHAADWRHCQRRRRGFTARRPVRRAGRGDAVEP